MTSRLDPLPNVGIDALLPENLCSALKRHVD